MNEMTTAERKAANLFNREVKARQAHIDTHAHAATLPHDAAEFARWQADCDLKRELEIIRAAA